MSKHLHVMIEKETDEKIRKMCKRSGDISWFVRIMLEAGLEYRETIKTEEPNDSELVHLHITISNELDKKIQDLCTRRGDKSWIVRQLLNVGLSIKPTENENGEGTSEDNNSYGEPEG